MDSRAIKQTGKAYEASDLMVITAGKLATANTYGPIPLTSDGSAVAVSTSTEVDTKTDNTAFAIGTDKVEMIGLIADEAAPHSVTDGYAGAPRMTLDRKQIIASNSKDDAAFTAASYVSQTGFLADEASTDSVDEGDVGVARMTLNRRQILAGQTLDDAAFGVGTEYANASGFLADEAATDSVDEGDIGIARMTTDRKQITAGQTLDDSAFGVATGYVNAMGALVDDTATDSVDEGDIGVPRMAANRVLYIQGQTAHDSAFQGNTLSIGGKAASSKPAAVTAGDKVDAYFDLNGRQRVYDEGGGGVGGGGFSTYYFTPVGSIGHGTSAYASGTTITVTGHTFSPEAGMVVKIEQYDTSGAFVSQYSPQQNLITVSTTSGTSTYTVTGATFAATDTFVIYQNGPERTVTNSSDTQNIIEGNSLDQKQVPETLAAVTNGTDATYYYYVDNSGFKNSMIQWILSGGSGTVTVTLEATAQDDGTAAASCTYADVTADLCSGTASFTATNYVLIDTPQSWRYIRVKVVALTGDNTADWTIYNRKIY